MPRTILLIDDDELLLEFLEEVLTKEGYDVSAYQNPRKAVDSMKDTSYELVLTDVKMNEMTGDEVLNEVIRSYPETGVIMMTGFGNVNHAVRCLHKGAFDYITKPFKAKEILFRVERFFQTDHTEQKTQKTATSANEKVSSDKGSSDKVSPGDNDAVPENGFIGEDPQVQKLLRIVPQIAKNVAPVLIQGESGTGKEVFAHEIHKHSDRSEGPYIKINCANLPSELVESTLFGHVKGAFTGAVSDRKGAFDAAQGGTLLLDEITEVELNVQAKLLRVLQEKEFYRVGSQEPVSADVRILATSNRNMGEAINEKVFREDLYYRLNVFPVELPPLRERKGDIPLLAQHFADSYAEKYGMDKKKISDELMDELSEREWRGNVRELNNQIHRGFILAQDSDEIGTEHINHALFSSVDDSIAKEEMDAADLPLISIQEMELKLIKKALKHTNGNQKKAAELLGISDRTIRNKLKDMQDED